MTLKKRKKEKKELGFKLNWINHFIFCNKNGGEGCVEPYLVVEMVVLLIEKPMLERLIW